MATQNFFKVKNGLEIPSLALLETTDSVGPSIRPSLLLDFENSKTLDPRVTFTRASTATYFDANRVLQLAASGAPRFDHDPLTGESKGLLIEEQRANLQMYSEQFDNAAWVVADATVSANAAVAPDGNTTADKLVETTSNSGHSISGAEPTSGQAQTFSIFAKAAERSRFNFSGGGFTGQGFAAQFDLSNGTITINNGNKASVTPVGNGWYRCSISFTPSNTVAFQIQLADNSGSTSYTGDGISGIYLWGAQLEAGAFATSYIPTTGAQATRAADSALLTGTNFSSWYNATEGTLYVDAVGVNNTASATRRFAEFNDGSSNNRQVFGYSATNASRYLVQSSAITQADVTAAATAGLAVKMAGAYTANYFQQASNGALGTADTSGTIPAVSQMNLGAAFGDSGSLNTMLNGHIRRIAYYRQRLPNAQLQAITA